MGPIALIFTPFTPKLPSPLPSIMFRLHFSYLDVSAEVADFVAACAFQVVISPSQQELLRGEFHQVLQTLPFSQKSNQNWGHTKAEVKWKQGYLGGCYAGKPKIATSSLCGKGTHSFSHGVNTLSSFPKNRCKVLWVNLLPLFLQMGKKGTNKSWCYAFLVGRAKEINKTIGTVHFTGSVRSHFMRWQYFYF